MANFDDKEILELWDNRARDWDIQVGDAGDSNRILNSDSVLVLIAQGLEKTGFLTQHSALRYTTILVKL